MNQNNPPKRITSTVINALKGGVVPRVGLEYIAVGREQEISALLHDIEIIAEGGAAFRFIVGRYGSGKSFLLLLSCWRRNLQWKSIFRARGLKF